MSSEVDIPVGIILSFMETIYSIRYFIILAVCHLYRMVVWELMHHMGVSD